MNLQLTLSTTLDVGGKNVLRDAISIDNERPQLVSASGEIGDQQREQAAA